MTNEQMAGLVEKLEQSARRSPALYRLRVLLLAMFGNAYLLFVLLCIVAIFLASLLSVVFLKVLAIKIIIPVAIFLGAVIKALWVKIPPPQGIRITRREAPALFDLIHDLRRRMRAPHFHRVLIVDDFNAAVVQVPLMGIFGWYRNYLLIGLPLMKMLTVAQFEAVLAHEFGHLSRGDGWLSNWIYRQRLRWNQLMTLFDEKGFKGSFLFAPFLRRFAPYFNAYSFPLARANEYRADGASVRATSAVAAAQALTAANVVDSYLQEHYWPGIYQQADETPQPAFAPFAQMHGHMVADVAPETINGWVEQAMQLETGLSDTHPSLRDRLGAIGEKPDLAPPKRGEGAEKLLGDSLDRIVGQFDRDWLAATEEAWRQHHEEVQQGRQKLAALDRKCDAGEALTLQESFDRAVLTERYGAGADVALAQFESLHQQAPQDTVVSYALGVRWLARDDERGVALVEFAMQNDRDAIAAGAEELRDYHWRHGRKEEAHRWHERLLHQLESEQGDAAERKSVSLQDKFDRHGLSDKDLEALRQQLRDIPGLRKVYLVRKRLRHCPERPLYILGFTIGATLHRKALRAEVQQRIVQDVHMPHQALVISVEGNNYRFGRKFRWMRGSRIL